MADIRDMEDLNQKELFEDLEYYVTYAQHQSPPFVDKTFDIIRKYIEQIKKTIECANCKGFKFKNLKEPWQAM